MSHHPADPRYVPTETVGSWPRGTASQGKVTCERCLKISLASEMEHHVYRTPGWPEEQGWFHPDCWQRVYGDMLEKETLALAFGPQSNVR
jgi:hypothetical protein